MKKFATFILKTLLPWVVELDAQALSNSPPNVMVILIDDMGFSDLGCYGGEARTPNIDALAANGLKFRNFHNTARCSPTRQALLTGLYTHQTATIPAIRSRHCARTTTSPCPNFCRLLAIALTWRANGIWAMARIKFLARAGFNMSSGWELPKGAAARIFGGADAYSFNSQSNEIPTRAYGTNAYEFHQTDAIGDYAVDFLNHHFNKADTNRFFMYLPFGAPHFDIQADKALAEFTPPGGTSYLNLYSQGWDIVRSNRYQRMLSARRHQSALRFISTQRHALQRQSRLSTCSRMVEPRRQSQSRSRPPFRALRQHD